MGHFYKKTGEPVFEVPKKDGKGMKSTTIREARSMGLVPSVTTIMQVLDKPALGYWLQQQALFASVKMPFDSDKYELQEWAGRVIMQSKLDSAGAADMGSLIHKNCENVFLGIEENKNTLGHLVQEKVVTEIGDLCYYPERVVVGPEGYAGTIDLISFENNGVLIDFKTKEKFPRTPKGKLQKMYYDEHIMQLAAYAHASGRVDADLYSLFIEWPTEEMVLHKWSKEDAERGWEMFKAALDLWYLKNGMKKED